MKSLFDVTTINGMTLKNRIVRSATWEGMCERDGRPTERLTALYRGLARGGVGLIITGYSFVRPEGKQMVGKMGIYTDDFLPDLKALTKAIHDDDGTICIQLVHAGGQAGAEFVKGRALAPSAIETPMYPAVPAEMTKNDIDDVIAAFGDAARRAKEAGFDGVQLHGAHGYLINQFLSPLTNRRTDPYGGSVEHRCRFLLEVYRAVRSAVGREYPVLAKLNGSDFVPGGLSSDDGLFAAAALSDEGIDAIEVSGGTPASGDLSPVRQKIDTRQQEAYNLPLAKRIRKGVTCPVMVVGGIRSLEVCREIIESGDADYVSFARPLIREPHLARRWQEGDRARARCISCNGCFKPGFKEGGIYCVVERLEQKNKDQSL